MTLLLAHFSLLALLSYGTARRLVAVPLDRILAAAVLFWGHVVALCLGLSCLDKLSDPAWFFRGSLLLGAATFLLVRRYAGPEPEPRPAPRENRSVVLIILVFGTLIPFLLGNLAIAAAYGPNNYDSLTYHLPRVLYYLGHHSLSHFETADFRQVYYPFNYNLLQLFCFVYDAPEQSVNFLNVAMWVLTGLGAFRIARLAGASFNAALAAAWLTLTSLEVLAQATSTILDMPAGAALLCTVAFVLRWRESRRTADAYLAAVAASLSMGTKLTMAFFGPTLVVLLLALAWHHGRAGRIRAYFAGVGAWIGPGMLAIILTSPFLIYNLRATGEMMTHRMDFTLNKPFSVGVGLQTAQGYLVQIFAEPICRFTFDIDWITTVNQWFARHVFAHWKEAYAFSELYTVPPDLNEDHVFFGFAGPLFLICAVICLARDWKLQRPMSWVALLGLGWFLTYFATNKWSLYNQRYFVPPLVVLAPCAAAVWDEGRGRLKRLLFYFIAGSACWCAGYYLLENNIRPVPLPHGHRASVLPVLPPLLVQRLAAQPRINVSSYGTNERIYPLLHLGHGQRLTSGPQLDPEKYSLYSFWGATRNYVYSNLAYYASYTIVPVPTKRSAGVEFLGTADGSADQFDYIGLPPHANDLPGTAQNRNVAVFVEYNTDTGDLVRLRGGRLGVIGLNPADGARIEISADMADGSSVMLLTATESTVGQATLHAPFKRLVIRVVDRTDGHPIGLGAIPYGPRGSDARVAKAIDPSLLFTTDLITAEPVRNLSIDSLAQLEGPYEKWDLPRFRWAKQATVRIGVPADDRLQRIRLTFDLRTQIRDEATLDVLHNGRLLKTLQLQGRSTWFHGAVEVVPAPGENVFELRDASAGPLPDWLAYLEQNPDVKAYVLAQKLPLEEGAREHYEQHGRAEGRALPVVPGRNPRPPPADSLYYVYRTLRVDGLVTPQ